MLKVKHYQGNGTLTENTDNFSSATTKRVAPLHTCYAVLNKASPQTIMKYRNKFVMTILIAISLLFSANLKAELNIDSLAKARGYDEVKEFIEGMAKVKKGFYVWFIDKEGKEIGKEGKYILSDDFKEGMAMVCQDFMWFIDKEGKEIGKEGKYEFVTYFNEGMASVRKDGYWFYIDKEGKEIGKEGKYEFVGNFVDGIAKVLKDGKWFYINKKGEEVE